ncbi:MAG TPA: trimethylamine methyltransferase family protein [Pelolinea sp.]|nr:trimethylamine methyltransferase family protein [Pelolinea sp.]
MKPVFNLLSDQIIEKILDEARLLLKDPGVRVHNREALSMLAEAGARVDFEKQIALIPEEIIFNAMETAPKEFHLYSLDGSEAVKYGGDAIQFDPGSAAISILDSETGRQRQPVTMDFVNFVKLVEMLPQIDAQSTAMICVDVPEEIGDLYRLYLALLYMSKPIITGAFRKDTWWVMKDLLAATAGGEKALADKPIAVFDVCPSPPLLWSDLTCQNMIDCARYGIPSELVSMPLTGATSPVTLLGAVVQHAAECLSGVVICQLAKSGAPIIWGGSPAAFDMRQGTTPMGAVETWMIDCAYTEVGKSLGMPTHAYLGMSDAKLVDAQSGLESSGGALLASLAGVNMISGAGMLDFESCQSNEKLVIDAEIIGMAKRLIKGLEAREDTLALELIRKHGHKADYLSDPHTLKWFSQEQYIPSNVIDRGAYDTWLGEGGLDITQRAKSRAQKLIIDFQLPEKDASLLSELKKITEKAAAQFGMEKLPALPKN